MRMEWKWCFRRKRAVLAALGAVLIIAILFNIASEMHSRHVQVSARLLKWVDFNVTAAAMRDALQYDIESHGTDTGSTCLPVWARGTAAIFPITKRLIWILLPPN